MVTVADDACLLTRELPEESARGNEDPARDVLGLVARQVGIYRRRVLRRRCVERGLCACGIQPAAAVQPDDVILVVLAGRQPRLRAWADHIRPHSVVPEVA